MSLTTPMDLLRAAVEEGNDEKIREAIDAGADVNSNDDDDNETALTWATAVGLGAEGSLRRVHCLLALGAKVAAEKPGGLGTSVHQAAENGYSETLRELLAADGGTVLEVFDDMNRTPLMCAVQAGHMDEALLLIEAGADIDARDIENSGDTALKIAVRERNEEMVRLLLKHGANPTIPGWMRVSAIDVAREGKDNVAAPELRRIFDLLERTSRSRSEK